MPDTHSQNQQTPAMQDIPIGIHALANSLRPRTKARRARMSSEAGARGRKRWPSVCKMSASI